MKQLANRVYCCYARNGGTLQKGELMNVGYVQYYFHQFNIDAPYAPKIPPHFSFFSHDLADVWHFCRQLGRNRT